MRRRIQAKTLSVCFRRKLEPGIDPGGVTKQERRLGIPACCLGGALRIVHRERTVAEHLRWGGADKCNKQGEKGNINAKHTAPAEDV